MSKPEKQSSANEGIQANTINAQAIAAGRGAKAVVTHSSGASDDDLEQAFTVLIQKVNALSESPEKGVAQNAVQALEGEAKKGDKAEEQTVRKWLQFLLEIVPDIGQVAIDTFLHPVKGLSTVFQKVAERAKVEREAKDKASEEQQ